jgi:hypothetical protein
MSHVFKKSKFGEVMFTFLTMLRKCCMKIVFSIYKQEFQTKYSYNISEICVVEIY